MNPKIEAYLKRDKQWPEVTAKLREIILGCGLEEDLKWGKPCYSSEGGNVVIIQGFKKYCALLFFKGVLLKDPKGILVKTGENTIVGRQIRFTDVTEVNKMETVLKTYIKAAIDVEKAGLTVDTEKLAQPKMPEELREKLAKTPALKTAFEALTPGRQRGFFFFISGAKQAATREARVEKCAPLILKGKGLYD